MASGLSMPVGFKNGTGGSVQLAVDAIVSSSSKHGFLGVDSSGNASMVLTKGNPNSHLVLRGGSSGPNYDSKSVEKSIELLQKANVNNHLIIDNYRELLNSPKQVKYDAILAIDILHRFWKDNKSLELLASILKSSKAECLFFQHGLTEEKIALANQKVNCDEILNFIMKHFFQIKYIIHFVSLS